MNWKAAVLGLAGWAPMLACCSAPSPAPSQPAEDGAIPSSDAWQPPTIVTTPLIRDYLASPTGSFEIVDGCLSFDVGEVSYTPVFVETIPPQARPDGLVWGGRHIRYGEKVQMGGGGAPRDLQIDPEIRRKCPGPYTMITSFPPRNRGELEALMAKAEARRHRSRDEASPRD